MWMMPMCRKTQVKSHHHWPPMVKRAEIRPPMPQLGRGWVEGRDSSQCHGDEDRNVDAENGLSHRHRTGLRAHPGRGFDSLDGGILAALRRFMLHAPLAKLFAEAEG